MRGVVGGKGVGVYRDNWNNWKGSLDWELEGCVLYNAKYDFVSTRLEFPPRLHYAVCKREYTRHHGFSLTKQSAMEGSSLG